MKNLILCNALLTLLMFVAGMPAQAQDAGSQPPENASQTASAAPTASATENAASEQTLARTTTPTSETAPRSDNNSSNNEPLNGAATTATTPKAPSEGRLA